MQTTPIQLVQVIDNIALVLRHRGRQGGGLSRVVLHEWFLLRTVVLAAVHANEGAVFVELHRVRVLVLGETLRLALQRFVLALDRALALLVLRLVAARNRNTR